MEPAHSIPLSPRAKGQIQAFSGNNKITLDVTPFHCLQSALPANPKFWMLHNTRKAVPDLHCAKSLFFKATSAFLLPFHSFPWFALPFRSQAFKAALKLPQASVESSWRRWGSGTCYVLSPPCSPSEGELLQFCTPDGLWKLVSAGVHNLFYTIVSVFQSQRWREIIVCSF